jgi:hypothetical protein
MTFELMVALFFGAGFVALLLYRFSPGGRRRARRAAAQRARDRRRFPDP